MRHKKKKRSRHSDAYFLVVSLGSTNYNAQHQLGIPKKQWRKKGRKKYNSVSQRLSKAIEAFFQWDDVTRMTAGKKQTITRGKVKKQKHLLNEIRKNLYEKYKAENATMVLSYAVFCRMVPFWAVTPTDKDRDTCLCKLHENMQYLVNKMKSLQLIETNNVDELLEKGACNTKNKESMYNECEECKEGQKIVTAQHDNTQ